MSVWVSEWMNEWQLFIDNLLTNLWLAITFGLFADQGYPIENFFCPMSDHLIMTTFGAEVLDAFVIASVILGE